MPKKPSKPAKSQGRVRTPFRSCLSIDGVGVEQIRVRVLPDGRMDRPNAAAYIGHSPKTLANWHSQGIGPECILVGGRAFYFKDRLDNFIQNNQSVA